MQPRTTGILLLLAAALGLFVYLYEIRGGERRREAEAQAKRLFPEQQASDVRSIALRTSDGRDARVEREDGGWRLVEPLEFPGDDVALDGLASALADLTSEGTIEDPQAPEVYGLADDARVIRFRTEAEEHEVRIGKKTPVGGNTYVAVGGDPRVFTVPSFRVNALQRSLGDLRERRLLRFERDGIQRIDLEWPGGGVVLAKRDAEWSVVEPVSVRADEETVETLLSDLAFLRAEGFVDDPPAAEALGLDPPALRAVLTGQAPEEEGAPPPRHELAIGALREGQGRVARTADGRLYLIPAERYEDLPRRVVAYRFKELTRLAAEDVTRLELVFEEPSGEALSVVAHRDDTGWTSEPEPLGASAPARLLGALSRLRATDIEAEQMTPEQLARVGLAPPRVVVRAFGEPDEQGSEPKLAELHLGTSESERGVVARIPERETIYRLDPGLAEDVPVSLEAFRNRFVASDEEEAASDEDVAEESPEDLLDELP